MIFHFIHYSLPGRMYLSAVHTHSRRIQSLPMKNWKPILISFLSRRTQFVLFFEEIFSSYERRKNIRVRDRATLFNLLIGLNGYTVCSGVIDENLNGSDIIAVPLAVDDDMRIGYITHKRGMLSRLGCSYLEALKKYFI